jgi:hypothetical protein
MVRFTRTLPRPHFPWIHIGSTLQRIEIRARQLLHFAEVACVKTKSRTKHLFLQIQMKLWRQASEHREAGMIVEFANNPLALIQNRIGQGWKNIGFGTLAVDLNQVDLRDSDFAQNVIEGATGPAINPMIKVVAFPLDLSQADRDNR